MNADIHLPPAFALWRSKQKLFLPSSVIRGRRTWVWKIHRPGKFGRKAVLRNCFEVSSGQETGGLETFCSFKKDPICHFVWNKHKEQMILELCYSAPPNFQVYLFCRTNFCKDYRPACKSINYFLIAFLQTNKW